MNEPAVYCFGAHRLDTGKRELYSSGFPVRLGGRAFDVLVALIERRDRTVSKHELIELVWPQLVVEENNLQVQIATLRKHLGFAAIVTVPGRGYKFTLEASCADSTSPMHESGAGGSKDMPAPKTNLPSWMPTLFGREETLSDLLEQLRQFRWITVVGSPGIGKSRLALAAARHMIDQVSGGVWWIDLAGIAEASSIAASVAMAMGLPLQGVEDPLQKAAQALSGVPSLLVLDNCEHVLEGIEDLVRALRQAAADVTVLLTSQEVVRHPDEHVFRLEPLSLPVDDSLPATVSSGAGALFQARAQASDRRFSLTEINCAAVADICRRLDGVPLAIELAAARVPLLGVGGLRARLDARFDILTRTDRTSQRRHRTLRDAMDWSHQLLSSQERIVFRRLGVFAGGFSLDAAQAVAEDEVGLDRWEVLEHLGTLVDKSLVAAEGSPVPRYRLLESVRLFALERLMEHGETDATRSAHRDHFLFVAEAANEALDSSSGVGIAALDLERDNLVLALGWRHDDDDGQKGLRLACAMHRYWTSRGMVTRGLQFLQEALGQPGVRGASRPRWRAETSAALFSGLLGRFDEAAQHAIRAAGFARDIGDDDALSTALARLGMMELRRGNLDAATRCSQEALSIANRLGRPTPRYVALELVSSVEAQRGNLELARQAEEEILLVLQAQGGYQRQRLVAHANLAWTMTRLGDLRGSKEQLARAIELLPVVDSELYGVFILRIAAGLAALSSRGTEAIQLMAAYRAHGSRMGLETTLERQEADQMDSVIGSLPELDLRQATRSGESWSYKSAVEFAAFAVGSRSFDSALSASLT